MWGKCQLQWDYDEKDAVWTKKDDERAWNREEGQLTDDFSRCRAFWESDGSDYSAELVLVSVEFSHENEVDIQRRSDYAGSIREWVR